MTKRFPLALAILSCSATWAPAQDFNLKPGLWEFTLTSEVKGDPASMLSGADRKELDAMSPEARARVEAMIKKLPTASAKPFIDRKCVTKEELHKLLASFAAGGNEAYCKFIPLRSTATVVEGREACSRSGMNSNAVFRFEAPNPETLTGREEKTVSGGSAAMEMLINTNGKWVGPSCGDVKP